MTIHSFSRVAILGTPVSSRNRGVLALGSALVSLCSNIGGGNEVVLMISNDNDRPVNFLVAGKSKSIPVVNCRLSPRSRYSEHLVWIVAASLLYRYIPIKALRGILSRSTPWIAVLEKSNIVGDIRGGDSFSDIYGMRRFMFGFFMAWTVLLVKGEMVQFPQTYGPYRSHLSRCLARYILNKSRPIIARDEESRRIAQTLLGSSRDVWVSPDVAFALEVVLPEHIEMDPPLNSLAPSGVIGLNVNGLMANGGYTRDNMFGLTLDYRSLLPDLVKSLLAEHLGELWLVPHTYGSSDSVESDPEACLQVRRALPVNLLHRVRFVAREYDQYEIKGVIGQCDFFIGSRMHACIAALSQGVPCVGIAYSMKFAGVFDTVGMRSWVIDGRQDTNEKAIARILELYRNRDSCREELARNAKEARVRLLTTFRRLFSSDRRLEK